MGRRQGHRHSRSAGRGPPAPGASRAGAPRHRPCAAPAALWTACSRGRSGGLLRCTWRSGRVQAPPPGPSWWQDPHCGTRKESICEPSPTPAGAPRLACPRPRPVRTLGAVPAEEGKGGLLQLVQARVWVSWPLVDQRGGVCSLIPLSQGGAPTLGTVPSDGRSWRESRTSDLSHEMTDSVPSAHTPDIGGQHTPERGQNKGRLGSCNYYSMLLKRDIPSLSLLYFPAFILETHLLLQEGRARSLTNPGPGYTSADTI